MPTILTQLSTEPLAAERTWTVEEIPVLTASVSLPTPAEGASGAAARRIRRYYQLQSRAFLRYCQRWLLPEAEAEYRAALTASAPLPQLRAELSYQVTYNESGLWSLYTQSRERGADGRTLLTRRGDTWDLASGYPVPLAAFFPRRCGWKKALLAAAEAEIRRREAAGAARWNEDWRRSLRRRFNPENFYLTGDGLAFFYPMYALAPAASGIPVFTLPYGAGGPALPVRETPEETAAPPAR